MNNYHPLLISLTLFLVSCKDATPVVTPDPEEPIPTATTIIVQPAPRLSRAHYTDQGMEVAWDKDDQISILDATGTRSILELQDAPQNTFQTLEQEPKPSQGPFQLHFPAQTSDTLYWNMQGQKQVGNNSTAHLNDYTFMSAQTPTLTQVVPLTHHTSQVKFCFTIPEDVPASQLHEIVFEANQPLFTTHQLANGSQAQHASSLHLALELQDDELHARNHRLLTAYLMMLPCQAEGVDFSVKLLDKQGNVLLSKMEKAITRNYQAGFQYFALMLDNPDLRKTNVLSETDVTWTQFGPGMSGNNKIAFWHPTDPDYLYISPNMGNSYLSKDRGKTYQTILDTDAASYKAEGRGPKELTSIDFSRTNPRFGFATDVNRKGIYQTQDQGETWLLRKELNTTKLFKDVHLSCVTVDPTDDRYWYVGAGKMRDVADMLYPQSQPHGATIHPNSQQKIWRSADQGKSWQLINQGLHPQAEVESILVDPFTPTTLYLSTNYGYYKSTDRGNTWTKKTAGLDNEIVRSLAMHVDHNLKQLTLFALCSVQWKAQGNTLANQSGGVFKSTDGGESWTPINGIGNNSLSLDLTPFAQQAPVLKSYYTTVAYYFGLSYNEAKARYGQLPHALMQRFQNITVDPNDVNNLYLTNDYSNASRNNFLPGALWRSTDGGQSWFITFRNGKGWLNGSSEYAYWVNRGNPVGNNVQMRYLQEWESRDQYDRKSCTFAKFNCDGSVLHTQMAKVSLMSYDKGETWVDIDDEYPDEQGAPDTYVGAGNSNVPGHGFYQHPDLPGKVYCSSGENSLWVTTSGGDKVRPNGLATTNYRFTDQEMSLSCYAIHPQDTQIHYALFFRQYNKGKLMRSTDGGATWKVHGQAIPEWSIESYSGDQSVHQLCLIIDPNDPNYMYFCVPWLAGDLEYVGHSQNSFGVHRSTDGGATWEIINQGLPASYNGKGVTNSEHAPSVARIAFDPQQPSTLYAAVERQGGGLYRSTDRGEHWQVVESTIPLTQYKGKPANAGVNDIHFDAHGYAYLTIGSINAQKDNYNTGLWVSYDGMKTWNQRFAHPNTVRVETARYNPEIILLTALSNYGIGYINPGTYLSRDGGITWGRINRGNGQSDRVNDIAIDYTVPGRYYASTYGSGWYYTD